MTTARKGSQKSSGNRRGAMFVLVAVSMVGLTGILALAIDAGAGNRQRRIAQTAADAAAVAGAQEIQRGSDSATIVLAAQAMADSNAFTSGVVVNRRPASGIRAGNPNFVEVLITRTVPTIFGALLGKPTLEIKARAVAGGAAFSTYCVYAMSTTGSSINLPPGSEIDASNCSVASNSDIEAQKLFALAISAAGDVDVAQSGSAKITEAAPPVVDPYLNLAVPAETSCDYTNKVVSTNQTLLGGVYCGGITINANTIATLETGKTFIIRGGGIQATGNNVELRGTEVTIINANGPGNDASAYRPIVFGNTCYVTLSAPTSGTFKGIVIFVDPNAPSSGPNSINELCGKGENGSDPDIVGTIYMPNQTFKLTNGNGKLVIAGTLIAGFVEAQNGGGKYTMQSDATGNSGVKRISLIE